MIDFNLRIKPLSFHRKVREGNKDVKVVILLLGSNNSGEQFTNLPRKGSGRINRNTVFSRHWSDKEGLFASVWSGHQTAQFLENQQNLLAIQSFLLFVHPSIGKWPLGLAVLNVQAANQ